jgi:hypothetical protein
MQNEKVGNTGASAVAFIAINAVNAQSSVQAGLGRTFINVVLTKFASESRSTLTDVGAIGVDACRIIETGCTQTLVNIISTCLPFPT